jgi:tetratricopeptide (TPR) repeat protein
MQRVAPTMYADALMWVRHSIALANGAGPQMRYTHVDNAPYGREIHWNSGFAWLIVLGGKIRQAFTHEPLPHAIEQSLAWFNLPLVLAFVVGISLWVARRAGLAGGVFLALALVGNDDFYGGFGPNYVDHHGILAAAVIGLVIGAVFMGGGFWRTSDSKSQLMPTSLEMARRGAIASAVFGGLGMWVSAATLIPAITIVGVAGVAAVFLHGPRATQSGVHVEPDLWRLWGKVGATVCFVMYVLEYAPFHLGLRLEVNHPVYAAGWWGGSEIMAQIIEWRMRGSAPFEVRWKRLGFALAAVGLAPLIIAIGGEKVFVVFDPFITRLSRHVAEGISLITAVRFFGAPHFMSQFIWTGVSLVLGLLAWWRVRTADRILLAFSFLAVLAFSAMEVAQLRWSPSAAGPQMVLIMLAIAAIDVRRGPLVRWTAIGIATIGLCLPFAILRLVRLNEANSHRAVDKTDAMQPVYRDIAAALRASQPEGKIVLLASPNASVAIGYYGLFETIGTLYWENLDGTKAAAEMFSAQNEVEARRLLRSRGVTHVALVSEDNFIAEYFDLLHPHPEKETLAASFGYKGLVGMSVPVWMDQIPYELPPDLPYRPARVLLFKTIFSTPEADTLYEEALEAADAGHLDVSATKLDKALALDPKCTEFWIAKTNLLLNAGQIDAAAAAVSQAVNTATPGQRFTVCSGEGTRFYQKHAHVAAAQLYRLAYQARPDPAVANNLAWVLATSVDNKARNGQEALAITTELVRQHKDVVYLNSYAAALAETGDFGDAAKYAQEALDQLGKDADPKMKELAASRVAHYQAGKPWRE